MINRTLIRIRVLQELFAYYHSSGKELKQAEVQLALSIDKTQDLYIYLLGLVPELTYFHKERIERRKNRLLKREEDLNPNMRLANNRLTSMIEKSGLLEIHYKTKGNIWANNNERTLMRTLLDEIVSTDIYKEYCVSDDDSFVADARFWVSVLGNYTFKNPALDEFLESQSVYWDSPHAVVEKIEVEERPDIDEVDRLVEGLVGTEAYHAVRLISSPVDIQKDFVLKTFRRCKEELSFEEVVLPVYKDKEDAALALQLMRATALHTDELKSIVQQNLHNWEMDRVTDVDMLILLIALAELLTFSNIPTMVTLNEYIDLAKVYSTSDSGKFVNGVLDSAVRQLRRDNRLLKV